MEAHALSVGGNCARLDREPTLDAVTPLKSSTGLFRQAAVHPTEEGVCARLDRVPTLNATALSEGPVRFAKQALVHATGGTQEASAWLTDVGAPVAAAKRGCAESTGRILSGIRPVAVLVTGGTRSGDDCAVSRLEKELALEATAPPIEP